MSDEALFRLAHVTYKSVLSVAALSIPAHRPVAVVGRSGGGKTTLLKLLNNLISPTSGTVYYRGNPLEKMNPIELRREVVMLPQTPVMFDGTVEHNLQIGRLFSLRAAAPQEELQRVLELVSAGALPLDGSVETLSGGEKQRVALARVLLMEPDALLLDEPSSALDQETEQQVIEAAIRHAVHRSVSVIMVTHSRDIARRFADVIIEVEHGRTADEQPPNSHPNGAASRPPQTGAGE